MKSVEFISIAEISKILNKQGDLGLIVFPGYTDSFSELDFVFIDVFGDKRKFIIENFESSGTNVLIKFANFNSADDVRFLCGKEIFIPKEVLDGITDKAFSDNDLIGCSVFFEKKFFGLVTDFERYPGNYVISIKNEKGNEILLPFVDEYFGNIDIDKKRIELIKTVEFTDDEN